MVLKSTPENMGDSYTPLISGKNTACDDDGKKLDIVKKIQAVLAGCQVKMYFSVEMHKEFWVPKQKSPGFLAKLRLTVNFAEYKFLSYLTGRDL
ncbi:unnamed protein product [Enterobius vermicularis]|uniref:FERM domain-containing protein n=1 Tax=Enterobius vermicularis TaxID=51028 RepID=A0A0N4VR04_ENTVE|nr:unnamed protein product [Enterobius vermicularis]